MRCSVPLDMLDRLKLQTLPQYPIPHLLNASAMECMTSAKRLLTWTLSS